MTPSSSRTSPRIFSRRSIVARISSSSSRIFSLQARQALEAHLEDRLRLKVREGEAILQPGARLFSRPARPDQGDDLVDVVEGDHKPLEDVLTLTRLAQLEATATADDVAAVRDEGVDQVGEVQIFGRPWSIPSKVIPKLL